MFCLTFCIQYSQKQFTERKNLMSNHNYLGVQKAWEREERMMTLRTREDISLQEEALMTTTQGAYVCVSYPVILDFTHVLNSIDLTCQCNSRTIFVQLCVGQEDLLKLIPEGFVQVKTSLLLSHSMSLCPWKHGTGTQVHVYVFSLGIGDLEIGKRTLVIFFPQGNFSIYKSNLVDKSDICLHHREETKLFI